MIQVWAGKKSHHISQFSCAHPMMQDSNALVCLIFYSQSHSLFPHPPKQSDNLEK